MTEEKKDLTGILQYAQEQEESGQAPQPSEGAILDEVPLEKIDTFESLEDYAANTPSSLDANQPEGAFALTEAPPLDGEPQENPSELENPDLFNDSLNQPTASEVPPQEDPSPALASLDPLQKVKNFAETLSTSKQTVPAAFPFSLLITGTLSPLEKEKLLDLLSRENIGIREIDLEPQLANGKILIPRISEYAGVLLVQALKSAQAEFKLGPADTIFATEETRTQPSEVYTYSSDEVSTSLSSNTLYPAESIPISSGDQLPGNLPHQLLDTLTASATLKSTQVEAESSSEYQEILEALQRELKYKAYRKGATAILHFKTQLISLSAPTSYRITVIGTAVKFAPIK